VLARADPPPCLSFWVTTWAAADDEAFSSLPTPLLSVICAIYHLSLPHVLPTTYPQLWLVLPLSGCYFAHHPPPPTLFATRLTTHLHTLARANLCGLLSFALLISCLAYNPICVPDSDQYFLSSSHDSSVSSAYFLSPTYFLNTYPNTHSSASPIFTEDEPFTSNQVHHFTHRVERQISSSAWLSRV